MCAFAHLGMAGSSASRMYESRSEANRARNQEGDAEDKQEPHTKRGRTMKG